MFVVVVVVCLNSNYDNACCGNVCNDDNACTDDNCVSGSCQYPPKPDGTTVTVADQTLVCCGGQAYLPDTGVCCGGEWKTDSGVCCGGNWIEGGECCDDTDCTDPSKPICDTNSHTCVECLTDDDCASKSCDNGVISICDTTGTYGNPYTCACPPCKSSEDCAEKNACCDTSSGKCYPEGTIIGNKLCDRPEWVLESSLLFKLANENPFSI